jgi:ATP-dependent helicase HrpB
MLIKARSMELGALACDVAALISERDPLRNLQGERRCDFALRLEALHAHRSEGNRGARHFGADPAACAAVERASRQWRRLLKVQANDAPVDESQVGLLLALAYPDRIAQRRAASEGRYLLSNGRGARLLNECTISSELIVAASLDGRGDESRIFLAVQVEQFQLETVMEERITWQSVVSWDRNNEAVIARDEQRLGTLVLAHRPLAKPDPESIALAMLDGVRYMGLESLPWSDEARQLQTRLCSLAHWQPQAGWPDTSDQALLSSIEEWLGPYLGGISRRDHLSRLNMYDILKNRLEWDKQQQLENAAPTHLQVPSGSRKKLSYSTDGSPRCLQ